MILVKRDGIFVDFSEKRREPARQFWSVTVVQMMHLVKKNSTRHWEKRAKLVAHYFVVSILFGIMVVNPNFSVFFPQSPLTFGDFGSTVGSH